MNWSNTTPTQDGLYWLRRPGDPDTLVKVYDIAEGLVFYGAMVAWMGSDMDESLSEVLQEHACSWFGPLTPPGELDRGPQA